MNVAGWQSVGVAMLGSPITTPFVRCCATIVASRTRCPATAQPVNPVSWYPLVRALSASKARSSNYFQITQLFVLTEIPRAKKALSTTSWSNSAINNRPFWWVRNCSPRVIISRMSRSLPSSIWTQAFTALTSRPPSEWASYYCRLAVAPGASKNPALWRCRPIFLTSRSFERLFMRVIACLPSSYSPSAK